MVHRIVGMLIDGALAFAGIAVGTVAIRYLPSFKFAAWVYGIVGIFVAGFGLSRDGFMGSVLAGVGLALTGPMLVSLPFVGAKVSA